MTQLGGCVVASFFGGMAESYRKTGKRTVEAQYPEMAGKRVAVVVAADRVVQAEHPALLARLTSGISGRLASGASAKPIPPTVVLRYLYNHPRWPAKPYSEIAAALGAETLLVVDLYEFRLHEPGNAWLWDGRASATVGVVEASGALPDDFSLSHEISVKFPDSSGYGKTDYTEIQVLSALTKRLIDRASWLFYDHKEDYYSDY